LAACGKENVSHSSYINDLGRKSTSIKVKDPLHERLLLDRSHLEPSRRYCALGEDTLEAALDYCTRDSKDLRSFTLGFYAS
jgi:hypothetical protein